MNEGSQAQRPIPRVSQAHRALSICRLAAAHAVFHVACLAACAPGRVQLVEPPAVDAPVDVRLAYYHEHRPMLVHSSYAVGSWLGRDASLLLEDGTRVDHPIDLLSMVPETSPTGRAARRATQAQANADLTSTLGWMAYGAGLVTMMSSLLPALTVPRDSVDPFAQPGFFGAMALLGTGTLISAAGIVVLPLAMTALDEAARERETAFLTLDGSLRKRLALSHADLRRRHTGTSAAAAHEQATPALALPTARLTLSPFPSSCPSPQTLRSGVATRLDRDPFDTAAADEIHVGGEERGEDVVITVEFRGGGEPAGSRVLTGAKGTCEELLARAALAIAVLLDPLAPVPASAAPIPGAP